MASTTPTFEDIDTRTLLMTMRAFKPWHWLTDPKVLGIDNIPQEGPILFVGNHTVFGVLDAPMLYYELFDRRRIAPRILGDHIHFKIPAWRQFLTMYGVVDGTRENCAALMQAGESILVFPGGAREVTKRKDQKYQLLWENRYGFARMALQYGCTIVPFAAVGVEDAFEIVLDGDDMFKSPLGPLLRRANVRRDVLLPLVRGIGPTPIPKPHRLYFQFQPPIEVPRLTDPDDQSVAKLRERAYEAVSAGIEDLRRLQKTDPKRKLLPRLASRFNKLRLSAARVKKS